MRQRFLPVCYNETCTSRNWEQVEQDLVSAARNLGNLYQIPFALDSTRDFPMNIAELYRYLKAALQERDASLYLAITEHRNRTTLATIKPVRREYDLFYVPLSALDDLHRDRNRPCFDIVLSLFAYLNQKAALPLPGQNDYLMGCYEAISEWITSSDHEMEEKEYNSTCAQIRCLYKKILILEKQVRDPLHLRELGHRIRSFRPNSETEKRLQSLARKFHRLHRRFPDATFYKNIDTGHLEEEEGERIYPDHYFSFIWDDHNWWHNHLMEYVNSDLQEQIEWEVPVSVQYFDRAQQKIVHALPFETRLLTLMDELCAILYRLYYEKHHG